MELESNSDNTHLFTYENGLTLIVREDHSAPVASVQAWCAAGSITEGEHLGSGKSHILEHMLFKGTERRPTAALATEIQSLGGYTNAYTTFDRTVYFIDLPAKNWTGALDILVDSMFNSTLPEDEYEKEMEVVRREFAMGFDDPQRTLQKLLFAHAFTLHPYKYPVIGYLDLFNQLSRDDVYAYYRKKYIPNNLTFIVVGDVDADEVYAELGKLAGDRPRQFHPDPHLPKEPPQLGRRFVERPFSTDTRQLAFAFHTPGITDPDIYALDILAILAGQGNSSRLHQALVEGSGNFRSIGTYSYTPQSSGLWGGRAVLQAGSDLSTDEAVDAVLAVLDDFRTGRVTPSELEKARHRTLASFVRERQTMAGQAASLGMSWFVTRDLDFDQTYIQGIEAVQASDIQRVARTFLIPEKMTVAVLNPRDQESPEAAAEADTSPATQSPDIEVAHLGDSIPVVLVQDPKVPLVTVRATFRGGLLAETPDNHGISQLLAKMLEQGTKTRDHDELAEAIESVGGQLMIEAGNNSFSVGVQVLKSDLDLGLDILQDVLFHPRLDPADLEDEVQKQLTDLALQKDNPMSLASSHLKTRLFGSHPYSLNSLGSAESLKSMTVDRLREFHETMLDGEQTVISVAGDFDANSIQQHLSRLFPVRRFDGEGLRKHVDSDFQATGATYFVPTDKVQAIVQMGFPGVSASSADRVAMDLLDESLSDLSSRLFIRIRDEQSLAYFVGTGQLLGVDPGAFIFYAGTRPDASEKVREEFLQEIKLLTTEGLSEEEFVRAKASLQGKRLIRNQTAATRAHKAALNVLYGLGADYEDVFDRTLEQLTREDVLAVAQKYLGQGNFSCIIVQPENPEESS